MPDNRNSIGTTTVEWKCVHDTTIVKRHDILEHTVPVVAHCDRTVLDKQGTERTHNLMAKIHYQ